MITAFGSFPGVEVNPSELLLDQLKEKMRDGIHQYSFILLPVEYDYCERWIENLKEDYHLVIHLGVASNSEINRVELRAKNFCGKTADMKGEANFGRISKSSLDDLYTELSLEFLNETHSYPVSISEDAGDYLCNFLYFKSLKKHPHKKVVFYHLANLDAICIDRQLECFDWLVERLLKFNNIY